MIVSQVYNYLNLLFSLNGSFLDSRFPKKKKFKIVSKWFTLQSRGIRVFISFSEILVTRDVNWHNKAIIILLAVVGYGIIIAISTCRVGFLSSHPMPTCGIINCL